MLPDRDRQLAEHMLEYARAALRIAAGESRAAVSQDERLRFSLCYALQVIGEAASHLSDNSRARRTGPASASTVKSGGSASLSV